MKKIAIMQPYFFPYIGYFQLIHAVNTFVIFDDVNFINKSYINRNTILVNNRSQRITLELIGASQNKQINKILIGQNSNKLLKTIEMAYKKAPYFHDTFPLLYSLFNIEEKCLAKFIGNSLIKISHYLNLTTRFLYSSQLDKNNELKAQGKIIDICKRLEASCYINSIGGQALYEKTTFLTHSISLHFLKSYFPEYQQFNKNFIPHLSIIDVLMFNDKNTIATMLNQYQLI